MSAEETGFADATWRKASFSDNQGNCVEVAYANGVYGVRDSKNPEGPVLRFSPDEFAAFTEGVRAGEFD